MPLTALRPTQALIDLVAALGGRWHGYTAMCRCPAHADRTPSLSLRQGERAILATCFAGCDPADILRELRLVRPDRHYPPPSEVRVGTANIANLWERSVDTDRSPLARRYLSSRRIDPPGTDVRFLARCPFGPRPATVFEPALLVAVREGSRLVAIQRIFLDPRTGHRTRKVMLGHPGSGAWQGQRAGEVLAIAEGFETAAAYTRLNATPCWAALGARRLDLLAIPGSVRELIIVRDEDPEGRRAADRAEHRYATTDRRLRQHGPADPFEDWAEALVARD